MMKGPTRGVDTRCDRVTKEILMIIVVRGMQDAKTVAQWLKVATLGPLSPNMTSGRRADRGRTVHGSALQSSLGKGGASTESCSFASIQRGMRSANLTVASSLA